MVGLLAAPVAAWSQSSTREEARETGQAAKGDTEKAAGRVEDSAQRAGGRMEDSAQRATGQTNARDEKVAKNEKKGTFADAHNFDVKGKVQKVSASSITIRRDDDKLPPVKLSVDKSTKVELDGERASVTQLKQGADVKASFNLREDKPIAVEIKADKTDTQKQMQDRREEHRERTQDMQQHHNDNQMPSQPRTTQ
jgi:hypothetical protein